MAWGGSLKINDAQQTSQRLPSQNNLVSKKQFCMSCKSIRVVRYIKLFTPTRGLTQQSICQQTTLNSFRYNSRRIDEINAIIIILQNFIFNNGIMRTGQ